MGKNMSYLALLSTLAINTAMAANISITSPATNAVVADAVVIAGACNNGSKVKGDIRDSNNLFSLQNSVTCANSKYSMTLSSAGLKAGNLRIRALQNVGSASQAAYVYVKKNAAVALTLAIETPVANAKVTAANQAAFIVNGGCTPGTSIQINATDSANKVLPTVWTGCNNVSDFHGQLDLTSLKDGNISIKAYVESNGANKTQTVVVAKSTVVVPAPTALQILAPAKDFAVNSSNMSSVEIAGKCTDKTVMKLQATDSANKLSEITWIMCENSNFWGPINMSSLADGNISVRAFQEVNGVMNNQYVNVIKKTTVATPALAVTLGALASVTEGKASLLTVNKVAGTAAGTVAYSVLNNASKAVISSGSLVFAAADTSKTISVLAPDDSVYNADMKLEIKVGSLASLIVPVVDNDPAPVVPSTKIMMGINGHDNFDAYPASEIEARVKVLADRNFRSFRNGGDSASQEPLWKTMDTLIAAGKKHNVIIRPAMYHWLGEAQAYKIAKRFPDIRVWEIGNEVDGDVGNEAKNIAQMVEVYKGIKRAAAEMGVEIKTTLNIMACYSAAPGRCYNKADGSGYFVDMAWAAGFKFDYISFHYYPYYTDKGAMYNMYLGQMRILAERYKVKILFNETNCAEIYPWSVTTGNVTDGGYAGDKRCYDSIKQLLTELNTNYKDIVQEINIYEMLDEPTHEVTHEKHFGMMYDINTPKPVFEMITNEFAK